MVHTGYMSTKERQKSVMKTRSTRRLMRKRPSQGVLGGVRKETSTGVKMAVKTRAATVQISQ